MIRQIGNKIFFFKCRRQSVCSSDSNTKYRSEPLEKIYFEPDHNCFYDDFFIRSSSQIIHIYFIFFFYLTILLFLICSIFGHIILKPRLFGVIY